MVITATLTLISPVTEEYPSQHINPKADDKPQATKRTTPVTHDVAAEEKGRYPSRVRKPPKPLYKHYIYIP
jgi:beta-xylosidase